MYPVFILPRSLVGLMTLGPSVLGGLWGRGDAVIRLLNRANRTLR